MTKAEVLYTFFASFGIPAYAADFVPDGAPFPRITYEIVTGDYGATHSFSASLWYRGADRGDGRSWRGEAAVRRRAHPPLQRHAVGTADARSG